MIAFYNEMTSFVDKGRAVDVVYLYLSKVFDTASCSTLTDKVTKYGLGKQTAR